MNGKCSGSMRKVNVGGCLVSERGITMKKKLVSVILTLVMAIAAIPLNAMPVLAATAFPVLSSSAYCEFTATKDIPVYRDKELKTRGTSSPARNSSTAEVWKGDVCKIIAITSSYIQLQYPTAYGTYTGYIKRGNLIGVTAPAEKVTNKGTDGNTTTYISAGGKAYGYTAKGDTVFKLGTSGSNYTLIIYTAKSGKRAYKLGAVLSSEYDSKILGNTPSQPTSSGLYCPISGIDAGYKSDTGLDISAKVGTPVYAVADATIEYSEYGHTKWTSKNDTAYSVNIKLDKPVTINGTVYRYVYYTHLSKLVYSKKDGSTTVIKVHKGDLIGYSGTANNSPHLHITFYDSRSSNQKYLSMEATRQLFGSKLGQKWVAGK